MPGDVGDGAGADDRATDVGGVAAWRSIFGRASVGVFSGYVARQVDGWSRRYRDAKTWNVPSVTMKEGILTTVTRKALMHPRVAAAANARMIAAQIGLSIPSFWLGTLLIAVAVALPFVSETWQIYALVLEDRDLVLEAQLALLQAGELKLIRLSHLAECRDCAIQIAMLDALMHLSEGKLLAPGDTDRLAAIAPRFLARANVGYVVIDRMRASPALVDFAIRTLKLEEIEADIVADSEEALKAEYGDKLNG